LKLVALVCAVLCLDGLDLQLLAFSAPLMLSEWGLEKDSFAPVLAAALFGMAFGTVGGGWASDRFGRMPTLLGSILIFGCATLACAAAPGPASLMALRFAGGLGFGAAFPAATALLSETLPPRSAAKAIGIMILGIPLGGMIGAAISSAVLPHWGWRPLFAAAGLVSLAYGAVMARILRRLSRRPANVSNTPATSATEGLAALISPRYRLASLGIWAAFLANSFATYSFLNWIPVLLTGTGMPLEDALRGSLIYNLAQIAGSFAIGWLASYFGLRSVMIALALVAMAGLGFFYHAVGDGLPPETAKIFIYSGLVVDGFCIGALQAALYILPTRIYHSNLRGRGVGVGAGFGRLGGISSTFVGGALLATNSLALFFGAIGLMLLLVMAGSAISAPRRDGFVDAPSENIMA
jgi:AAHS family 4-hydroxybenzoate transporter-like MFS transporter